VLPESRIDPGALARRLRIEATYTLSSSGPSAPGVTSPAPRARPGGRRECRESGAVHQRTCTAPLSYVRYGAGPLAFSDPWNL